VPKRARLITLGLVVFVLGVILFFPARVAYRWFSPPDIQISGISGSVWRGKANEANFAGTYFRDLNWQFQPLKVFSAVLGYTIQAKLASGFLEGDFGISISGVVVGQNISAALPLQALQASVGIAGLSGNLSAQFSELEIDNNLPVVANGIITVSGLIVPLVQRESLGGFKAEFFTQDTGIGASVEDVDAVLELAGSLTVSADRSYRFLAQLSANEKTPAPVRQQLQFLGSANDRGQHELRLEGIL
jgi:general secretion pathway protein N